MHRFVIVALVLFVAAGAAAAQELKTDQDKALYAIGVSLSERLGPFALTAAELEFVKAGLSDGVLGKPKLDAAAVHEPDPAAADVARGHGGGGGEEGGRGVPGQGGGRAGRQAHRLRSRRSRR